MQTSPPGLEIHLAQTSYLSLVEVSTKRITNDTIVGTKNIATAAIPFLKGMPLNLLPANTEFGKKAMEKFTPFYNK